MDIRTVNELFAVAPQIQPSDMQALAAEGFVSVICNRPDGEEDGQPSVKEMRAAAQDAGLTFHYIPVSGGVFPDSKVAAFRQVRRGTEGAVLAYCLTGTRSIILETIANPKNLTAEDRLKHAANAGYDLSPLRDQLGAQAQEIRKDHHA